MKHWYNLQRAADGKSAFYVPTSGQHVRIADEQARLTSMSRGCQVLARIWQVEPKPGSEIPGKTRRLLAHSAHVDIARTLNANKVGPGAFGGLAAVDIIGLEDLCHYLDIKMCLTIAVGEACPEYASLGNEIGFVPGTTGVAKLPPRKH